MLKINLTKIVNFKSGDIGITIKNFMKPLIKPNGASYIKMEGLKIIN